MGFIYKPLTCISVFRWEGRPLSWGGRTLLDGKIWRPISATFTTACLEAMRRVTCLCRLHSPHQSDRETDRQTDEVMKPVSEVLTLITGRSLVTTTTDACSGKTSSSIVTLAAWQACATVNIVVHSLSLLWSFISQRQVHAYISYQHYSLSTLLCLSNYNTIDYHHLRSSQPIFSLPYCRGNVRIAI